VLPLLVLPLLELLLLLELLAQPAATMVTAAAAAIAVARAVYLPDIHSSWRVEMRHRGSRE
jgi:hypothetical protein